MYTNNIYLYNVAIKVLTHPLIICFVIDVNEFINVNYFVANL